MQVINKTVNCIRCGSINLKVVPRVGRIDYLCADCGKLIETVEYEKYIVMIKSICPKCNSDTFKATVNENDGKKHWKVNCSKCNAEPEEIYADKRGNVIEQNIREILIIEDSIEELSNKFTKLKEEFDFSELDRLVNDF